MFFQILKIWTHIEVMSFQMRHAGQHLTTAKRSLIENMQLISEIKILTVRESYLF